MKIGNKLSANCVKCDVAGCASLFHSYSTVSIIRKQAKSAGWKRVSRASVMRAFSLPADSLTGGRSVDVCPQHIPPPRQAKARAA